MSKDTGILSHISITPRRDGKSKNGHIGFMRVMKTVASAASTSASGSLALSYNYSLFKRQDGSYGVLPSNPITGWKDKLKASNDAKAAKAAQLVAMLIALKDEKPELATALTDGINALAAPILAPFGIDDVEKLVTHELFENQGLAYEAIDQAKADGALVPGTFPEAYMVKSAQLRAMRVAALALLKASEPVGAQAPVSAASSQDENLSDDDLPT